MKLVMLAGLNDPEVIDFETPEGRKSVAEALIEFGDEDVILHARTHHGTLEYLSLLRTEYISADDQFVYLRTHWKFWDTDGGTDFVISVDWDQRR